MRGEPGREKSGSIGAQMCCVFKIIVGRNPVAGLDINRSLVLGRIANMPLKVLPTLS